MKNLYEMHTATWLYRLSQEAGAIITLATVPDAEIKRIASYNIDAVWLMGVWTRSPRAAQLSKQDANFVSSYRSLLSDFTPHDIIGSAYAIRSYEVDERFGGEAALLLFRARLAAYGIKLILDFVPNHSALDSPWLDENPEFYFYGNDEEYVRNPHRFDHAKNRIVVKGSDPTLAPWPDVAQLNAFSQSYRQASIRTLNYIATICDGVRCDMAMLMLNRIFSDSWRDYVSATPVDEYWKIVINAVRYAAPDFIFLAESYWDTESELLALGFDYCYDKKLYDFIVAGDYAAAKNHIENTNEIRQKLITFLENHDEPRIANILSMSEHARALRFLRPLPGLHLWYDGQFCGFKHQASVHLRRSASEKCNKSIAHMYKEILSR